MQRAAEAALQSMESELVYKERENTRLQDALDELQTSLKQTKEKLVKATRHRRVSDDDDDDDEPKPLSLEDEFTQIHKMKGFTRAEQEALLKAKMDLVRERVCVCVCIFLCVRVV